MLVDGVLGEEFLDGGILPDHRQDGFDGVAALHGWVIEMAARDLEEIKGALTLHRGLLAAGRSPIAIHPRDEVGLGGVAPNFVGEFLGDCDLVTGPVVDGALFAEDAAEGFEEADVGVLGFSVEPLDVPR